MNNKKGFTLIEMMTIIAIIGILSLIAIPSFNILKNKYKSDTLFIYNIALTAKSKAITENNIITIGISDKYITIYKRKKLIRVYELEYFKKINSNISGGILGNKDDANKECLSITDPIEYAKCLELYKGIEYKYIFSFNSFGYCDKDVQLNIEGSKDNIIISKYGNIKIVNNN